MSLRKHIFSNSQKLSSSERLYYDSRLIRDLKRKIADNNAYFRISYPSKTDIQMATYLNIPILSGNLENIAHLELRSCNGSIFGLKELKSLKIEPNKLTVMSLLSSIITFCEDNKRYRNYVVKINGHYQSTGIGLLTYPFDSLPHMYTNTAFVVNSNNQVPS